MKLLIYFIIGGFIGQISYVIYQYVQLKIEEKKLTKNINNLLNYMSLEIKKNMDRLSKYYKKVNELNKPNLTLVKKQEK